MMKAQCAWCNVDLGWRNGPAGQITHGICDKCRYELTATDGRQQTADNKQRSAVHGLRSSSDETPEALCEEH